MSWNFDNDKPIYTQILEHIEMKIIAGEYPPGSKVPSVRDLAAEAQVNPNTMQRALQELERKGLVVTQRTSGRTVTTEQSLIDDLKKDRAREYTCKYLTQMKQLGLNFTEIITYINEGDF